MTYSNSAAAGEVIAGQVYVPPHLPVKEPTGIVRGR